MTLEKLKEKVGELISRAKTKEAIEAIIKWAKANHQKDLKKSANLVKGRLESLNSEKLLGVLSTSEATTRENQIAYSILGLLDNVSEDNPVSNDDTDKTPPNVPEPPSSEKLKILMLTANPAGSTKLNLDREYATIMQKLQGENMFNILLKKAVSGDEFREFTQQEEPAILHFSGHGKDGKYKGIVVQNNEKNEEELIHTAGLKALFKRFKKRFKIQVVVLNACHTQEQAAVISKYVDYVIGTNVDIGDTKASAFSSGFYFQLAEENSMDIEDAFDSGRTAAVMKGAAEENFVIYKNGELIEVE